MDSPFPTFCDLLKTMSLGRVDELHQGLVRAVAETRSTWQADERLYGELCGKKPLFAHRVRNVFAVNADALTALSRHLTACTNLRAFEEMAQLPEEKRHRHLYH